MNIFYQAANKLQYWQELYSALESGRLPASVTGLSAVHKAHVLLMMSLGRKVLALCDDEAGASRLVSDINEMAGSEIACLFPVKDLTFANIETASQEYEQRRIASLERISLGKSRVLVASIEACMQSTMPPDKLSDLTFTLRPGDSAELSELASRLVSMGYTRSAMTEGPAQFSIRGSIFDVFPVGESMPYRIELWGDDIDTVSTFDVESQRRFDTVKSVTIPPAKELLISKEELLENLEALSNRASGKKK
ncbi:MAG TPA: transcription-repair coupling factor, partial [Candidatus Faeciplasma pullistercoris]|nr:transcription-repair coupling factor [Candidatus Faeciplasma pullistercoris]